MISISTEHIFALGCDELKLDLPDGEELIASTTRCIEARSGKGGETPNSITDFVCPQGNMFLENNQSISTETLRYLVSASIIFNKIDIDITKYMLELQKIRKADPTEWAETISKCSDKIRDEYAKVCQFGTIETLLNIKPDEKHIVTTNTYPQVLCGNLAAKKIQGWYYLQAIIASDAINKNQKNSTDKWVTEVKGAYAGVLKSWHNYQKIMKRAISKMTGYTKESN